jgi:5-methylcytosine-specific restriction endonuclease McrA
MLACRVCLRRYKDLRFRSDRISICGHCVNALNEGSEVAQHAEKRLGELLLRGMERNANLDLTSEEQWKKNRAERKLADLEKAHTEAMPKWLNRLVADPKNTSRDFKVVRAFRRGLLHYDPPAGWGYPKNWKEVAARIGQLDQFRCVVCSARDRAIDVHHIVYVSNFGTHQQSNLVSLCRECHEVEHERTFDFGEVEHEAKGNAKLVPLVETMPAQPPQPTSPKALPLPHPPPELRPQTQVVPSPLQLPPSPLQLPPSPLQLPPQPLQVPPSPLQRPPQPQSIKQPRVLGLPAGSVLAELDASRGAPNATGTNQKVINNTGHGGSVFVWFASACLLYVPLIMIFGGVWDDFSTGFLDAEVHSIEIKALSYLFTANMVTSLLWLATLCSSVIKNAWPFQAAFALNSSVFEAFVGFSLMQWAMALCCVIAFF